MFAPPGLLQSEGARLTADPGLCCRQPTTLRRSSWIEAGESSPFPFTLLAGQKSPWYIEQGRVRYSLLPAQATKLRLGIVASLAS
jgi:hypothetical protein